MNLIKKIYAQNHYPIRGIGKLGLENVGDATTEGPGQLTNAFSSVIGLLTIIGGLYFIIQIIMGGYTFINSQGKPDKLEEAQKKLTNSFIGLFVVVAAYFLLGLAGDLLHVDFFDLETQIENIMPH